MAAAGGIPLESLDKDQLKTVSFLCGFIKLHDFILNLTSMTFKLILLIAFFFSFLISSNPTINCQRFASLIVSTILQREM